MLSTTTSCFFDGKDTSTPSVPKCRYVIFRRLAKVFIRTMHIDMSTMIVAVLYCTVLYCRFSPITTRLIPGFGEASSVLLILYSYTYA
jgi:hypothetical protein